MNKNVLICDDEPIMIELIRLSLEEKGYKIYGALNGDNFRRKILEINPAVIILDLNMIMIRGDGICRYLKNNFKTKDIPVIIFSASINGKKIAMEAGADFFVSKSKGIHDLEKAMEDALVRISNA